VTIEVLEPGLLTTVQDPFGRPGWRHLGVPVGGAADAWSARLANRLVGNRDDAAVLEMTLDGPTVRLAASTILAVTGGLAASVDGLPLRPATARRVRAGATLRVGPGGGARGYLAVAGGIDVAPVLGSRSTELRAAFGGLEGRALRAADRLRTGSPAGPPMRWTDRPDAPRDGPIRVVAGPHAGGMLGSLLARTFTVSQEADRIGVRLLEAIGGGGEAASMGLPLGAIQVPPDGRPILMLADRPITGGYVVPAVIAGVDVGRAAQLRPGDAIGFAAVTASEARAAWRRADYELAALEPLERREDDELGWTGSHR
jgi:biotin-dependent carboxylase-like uncharacterized protein